MKKIFKTVAPFVGKFLKGALKSVPGGNLIVDGIENATKKDLVDGTPEPGHDKLVWMAELIGLVCILGFLVSKNIIPSDILIKVIKAILDSI